MTELRVRRRDAVANQAKVLEAARAVFAERGQTAGVDEVAARAGVGKATVYRCYPTKDDLVAAVLAHRLTEVTDTYAAAARARDPWAAFAEVLTDVARSAARNALLPVALGRDVVTDELELARVTCTAALEDLVAAVVAQGRARSDLTARDVTLLLGGALRALHADGVSELAAWERCAELVVSACRA